MAFEHMGVVDLYYDESVPRLAIVGGVGATEGDGPPSMIVVSGEALAAAACIGCGCTAEDACLVDDGPGALGPCTWLELDENAGLCSACEDHRDRWNAGERTIPLGDRAEAAYDGAEGVTRQGDLREQGASGGGAASAPATARPAPREGDDVADAGQMLDGAASTSVRVQVEAGAVVLVSRADSDRGGALIAHRMSWAEALVLAREIELTVDELEAQAEAGRGGVDHA